MRFASQLLYVIAFLAIVLVGSSMAGGAETPIGVSSNKATSKNSVPSPAVEILPIKPALTSLLSQLNKTPINSHEISHTLAQLTLSKAPLNAAEQYLLLVVQALVKEKLHHKRSIDISNRSVVELLAQADKLSIHITEQQLVQPNFIQLHLILAEHYENLNKYDLAYLEKESYLEKYHVYRKNKRLAMIASLEESFEVKDKKASNDLLKSRNELKIRRVAKVKNEKATQEYNFTLIISVAVVFVLLFFRQLTVRQKLIQLTLTDSLTGLSNRSALFEKGKKMVSNFTNKPDDLSVLLLDLDFFKKINDNYGNNVGDKVLRIVAKLVQETMRSRDVLSRLGGEEFVALLPYADTHKAKAIAMRINEKIALYDFSNVMSQSKVTVSIGVATMEDNKMNFDDLLHCADLAMYQAKEQGRNTVVCYNKIAVTRERRAN